MDAFPATGLADGRFRLVRLLGEGGMGKVFEAFDRDLRAPVAIKMMRSHSAEALLRLKREFRSLQEVRHDNLVRLGELFVEKDDCYFTMELVDGVDFLDHVLVRASKRRHSKSSHATVSGTKPLPRPDDVWDADTLRLEVLYDESRLRAALRQVADGLAALHQGGKVHRDLKPSNVLITPEGRVVLLDLGLAVDAGDELPVGIIEGTIEYMAPEQAAGATADPSSDLYALGAVLYEALTGRPPFVGEPLEVLRDKQVHDPIAPQSMFAGVPSDLDELCLALLRRDPARRPTAREVADGLADAGRPDWQRRGGRGVAPRPEAPFVGRAEELAALQRALEESARRPVVLLIEGEAGVGKSALVRRFAAELRGSGALVLAGRCDAQESVPFRAFDGIADALTRWLVTLDPEERTPLLPEDAPVLSRLFRVFERLVPPERGEDGGGLDVRARRRRAFAVLRELLGAVARRQPTALVIDDLQWIDGDTVQLLEAVFALRPPPLLLIGNWVRSKDKDRMEPLRAALAPLDVDVREMTLRQLGPSEAAALAWSLLPEGDEEIVVRIASSSGGSPLFLEQMAAAAASGRDFPDTLEGVLFQRISELDSDAREVLEVVCMAGLAIDLGTVARACGMARQDLAQALARLEDERLVRTTGARRNDVVEPYHDSVRQAARAMVTPEQAKNRHRVLAEALEKRAAAPWLVFHHFLAAGEPAMAAPFAVEAAVRARRELSARRVARLCRVAIELLPAGHAARGELCRAYAVALANAGQGAEAARWYLEAAAAVDGVDTVELRRRAADHLLRCGRIDDGMAVVREVLGAVGVATAASTREAVTSLLWRRARVRLRGMRGSRASGKPADPGALLRADVCLSIGMSLGLIDTVQGAGIHALGALEAMRLGDPDRLARALAIEAAYAASDGTRGESRTARLLDDADAAARRARTPLPAEMVRWSRGIAEFLSGRYREALAELDAAARGLAERCPGQVWELASCELFAAWALSHLGRLDELERRLSELERTARWNDDRFTLALSRTANGVLPFLAADRPDEATARVDHAMAQWSQAGFHLQHMMDLVGRTEIDLYRGDGEAAWRRLEELAPVIQGALVLRVQHTRITHLDLRARAALAAGDRARLADIEENARKILKERAPWAAGHVHARLAAVAAAAGRTDEAVRLLATAGEAHAAAGLVLPSAAVRLRRAELRGERIEDDPAWGDLVAAGVRHPERWMAMYAPWIR